MDDLRPNRHETAFLTLAYDRFYDLFDEVMDDAFWNQDDWYRFSKITNGFSIYSELLAYEPIACVVNSLKSSRPPMESEIGSELFRFVRNVLAHFPFFTSWNEIWISKNLVNWRADGKSIDRFLSKYVGHKPVKYRFWEPARKRMTYLQIAFPSIYKDDVQVTLREMISEKDGVRFCFILMKQIMDTQVASTCGLKVNGGIR